MPTPEKIRGELRVETVDDYADAPSGFRVTRGESHVGAIWWDDDVNAWRCARSLDSTDPIELSAVDHEQAIEQALDLFAAKLADS